MRIIPATGLNSQPRGARQKVRCDFARSWENWACCANFLKAGGEAGLALFSGFVNLWKSEQTASRWFCSHTVQAPEKPKPLRSHSMASKPWMVRRAVLNELSSACSHSAFVTECRENDRFSDIDGFPRLRRAGLSPIRSSPDRRPREAGRRIRLACGVRKPVRCAPDKWREPRTIEQAERPPPAPTPCAGSREPRCARALVIARFSRGRVVEARERPAGVGSYRRGASRPSWPRRHTRNRLFAVGVPCAARVIREARG